MGRVHKHIPGTAFRRNYPVERLERALQAVIEEHLSFAQAGQRFGVPVTTIWRKFLGLTSDKLGKPPVLKPHEEKKIVKAMIVAASYGYPFTRDRIILFVQNYLNKKGVNVPCFHDNKPGKEWLNSFDNRNPELTRRNCENMKRVKADLSDETINNYFNQLTQELEGVPPANIINFDETNLCDDPGKEKVYVSKGTKHASRVMDSSKASTSVMFAGSGDGVCLPPYVVYKSKHFYPEWCEGGPPECRFNRTEKGWFDSECFEDWFFSIAIPYFRRKEGRKIMIGDNLRSHLSMKIIESCEQNNIGFIFLPKNSTHICQPMDVAVFGPLKKQWRKLLKNWKENNSGVIPKSVFPTVLKKLLLNLKPKLADNIKAGFLGSGIIPLDRSKVLGKLLKHQHSELEDDVLVRSFSDIMADKTNSTTEPKKNSKRSKKFNVSAGKSISIADFQEPEPQAGPSKRAQRRRINSDSEEQESVLEQDENMSNTYNTEPDEIQNSESYTNETESSNERCDMMIDVDSFVIVKLIYDKGTKKESKKNFWPKF